MKLRTGTVGHPFCLVAGLLVFLTWQCLANTVEVDWTSSGFSTSHITINAGDEVDIVNYDYYYDLQVTGASPEGFYADVPPTDGYNVYYVPYVYNNPGTFSFSDEFGDTVTVTVNPVAPLSVAITDPTNNEVFSVPATFTVTAVPAGGATPYVEMDFYVGTNWVGVTYNAPFTNTVSNLPAGTYNLSAVVTDYNFNTATNSINVTVGVPAVTNYILPVDCADIYSSGAVDRGGYLDADVNDHGALEFAEFDVSHQTSILLELNPYGLPLFGPVVSVYGFDGGNGTLMSSNYNSGTLIGMWTLPAGLGYGQVATFDITAFVKSTQGPYFGIVLAAGGDLFSSTTINYGTPPELYAIGARLPPPLTATRAGNQIIISWPVLNTAGFSLQTSATVGPGASWNGVSPPPALVGSQWVVTNSISGSSRFFRLSNQ
jgi:Bacterial Ig domain